MPNHFRAIGATTFLSPIPAVMLSCRGTEPGFDKDNLITVAWAGVINSAPPMISVSLRPSRHSYAQIVQSGVFCLNLIDQSLCRAADFCGVKSGRDVDKFKEMRLHARGAFQRLLPFRFRARVQPGAQHAVRQQSDILPALVQIARDAHIIGACGQGVRQAQQRRGKLMGKVLRIGFLL